MDNLEALNIENYESVNTELGLLQKELRESVCEDMQIIF